MPCMNGPNDKLNLTQNKRNEITSWLEAERDKIPQVIVDALGNYDSLLLKLLSSDHITRSFLVQLRRALGITPSSEKSVKSGIPGAGPKIEGRERLENDLEEYKRKQVWHKSMAKKHGEKIKKVEARLLKVEDIELSAEDYAEMEKENEEQSARLESGNGVDPSLESPTEPFMRGVSAAIINSEEDVPVSDEKIAGREIKERLYDARTRYGFSLNLKEILLNVEKVIVVDENGEKTIISASTHEFGPERMDVTWEFLTNLCLLVAQYAFPFNRLAGMLSVPHKTFTSGALANYFKYVATRFAPVYLQLFKELSPSTILSGDDTSPRVTEVNRYFIKDRAQDPGQDKPDPPPWELYSTPEVAAENIKLSPKPSLGLILGQQLPFVSNKRTGEGTKKSLQTTVIWGRPDSANPRSSIVFYRSHLGSTGNLLEMILKSRPIEKEEVWIQSDLATINLVADPELNKNFKVTYAGCTSHARRPFSLYKEEDPDNCDHMLHLFKGLYIYEEGLDLVGRNEINTLAVRGVDSIHMWECILELAHIMSKTWSKETKLGRGCRYIIKHYDKLTAYTKNPRLSLSNDFSERMLRMEKLIQASSLFRNTLEGRFALDINRTIFQTAIAAGNDINEYCQFVLRSDPNHVQKHPELYTPMAFAKIKNAICSEI